MSPRPAAPGAVAPGPRTSGLAQLGRMRRDPIALFMDASRDHGDVARLRLGPREAFLLRHPDHVQHVLTDHQRDFDKQSVGYRKLRLALGDGLLTSEGELWRRQRRIAQPAFHRDRLRPFAVEMVAATERLVARWDALPAAGGPIDVSREMMRLTLEIVCRTLLGADLTEDADTFGVLVTETLEYVQERMTALTALLDFAERLPTPRNRRFREALRRGDAIITRVIEQRRGELAAGAARDDLLSMLLQARDPETGEGMSDRQLRDEVVTMFTAGHETTANTLTWTLYLLSLHPAVDRLVRAELAAVLAGRAPTLDDLPRLEVTTRVIKESLRLYPPAWAIGRRAAADQQIGGFAVAAGAIVLLSPWVTHRDARWWPNPEGFDPDRFLPERADALPRYAWFPFGGGPRMCIGAGFAMMEAQLALATLLPRYRPWLTPGHRIELEPLITLRPRGGMPMRLERVAPGAPQSAEGLHHAVAHPDRPKE